MVLRPPTRLVMYGGAAAGLASEDEIYARHGVAAGLAGKGASVGLSDVELARTVQAGQRGNITAKSTAIRAGVDNQTFFVANKSSLDRVDKVVSGVIQVVTIAGIAVGAAAVAGLGPAAAGGGAPAAGSTASYSGMALGGGSGSVGAPVALTGSGLGGTSAATSVTAAAAGTSKVASFASLVKPVTGLVSAASSIAGLAGAGKGAGMSAQAGLPAYTDQLTPTTPAGIVQGPVAAENKVAWLAIAAVVVAVIFLKG